jgi:hypothetical protein
MKRVTTLASVLIPLIVTFLFIVAVSHVTLSLRQGRCQRRREIRSACKEVIKVRSAMKIDT